MRRHFPAAARAAVTHHWGGPLAVPRDWCMSVAYDRARRVLTYSNAGHPAALLFTGADADGSRLVQCKSCGLAVGMMEGTEFDSKTVELGRFARLLLYSDGVYEIDRSDGPMWKHQEFVEYVCSLRRAGDTLMTTLLSHARGLHGADILADDFSILDVLCSQS